MRQVTERLMRLALQRRRRDPVELGHIGGAQLEVAGLHVGVDLVGLHGARDHARQIRMRVIDVFENEPERFILGTCGSVVGSKSR